MTKQNTPDNSNTEREGLDALVTSRILEAIASANIPFEISAGSMTVSQLEQAGKALGVEPATWFRSRES